MPVRPYNLPRDCFYRYHYVISFRERPLGARLGDRGRPSVTYGDTIILAIIDGIFTV